MCNSFKAMIKTAWLFIKFDKAKSLGALAGTIMSVFLIGQQTGVFIFLTNAMASIVKNNSSYIWVVDDKTSNANALAQLDTRIGFELSSVAGVEKVYPLVIAGGSARFNNGTSAGVSLIGVKAPDFAGGPWNQYVGKKEVMLQDNAVITDHFDQKTLGGVELGDYFEINGHKVFNAGLTKGVRAFGGGVYAFTTIERARYLGNVPVNKVSAYLVKWKSNEKEEDVVARINKNISGVKARTSSDFANETILTVLKISGIAISFGTLILFALVVGFVIIGLTLYSSTLDRIKDYGTLKAIGADNKYIRNLITMQARLIHIVGFAVGMAMIEGFRNGIAKTGVFFDFPWWLRMAFFMVTLMISLLGSSFAIRRITKLEPAQVFRG
jgi:putative ABC transport system permease protein